MQCCGRKNVPFTRVYIYCCIASQLILWSQYEFEEIMKIHFIPDGQILLQFLSIDLRLFNFFFKNRDNDFRDMWDNKLLLVIYVAQNVYNYGLLNYF